MRYFYLFKKMKEEELQTKLSAYSNALPQHSQVWTDLKQSAYETTCEIKRENAVALREFFQEGIRYMGFETAHIKLRNRYIKLTVEEVKFDDIPEGAECKTYAI